MKRIAILGSTGSIGAQTLDIVRRLPSELSVVGLAAHRSGAEIRSQAAEFGVSRLALMDESSARNHGLPGGMQAVIDLACADNVDLVVVAVAGVIGLKPVIAAIEAGKQIALASKEVLVAAGEIVMPLIKERGVPLTPIDSEHSAVFQCLQGSPDKAVDRIILTASGGPFRGQSRSQLEKVTREQALDHPTWSMGGKITVDSATMMNKGLEIIEACHLFGLPEDRIDVVIHPQSIIHSFVQFQDTSVLGQCGWPDMRIPIQYALLYPARIPNQLRPWNPVESSPLTFESHDADTFECPSLAREAIRRGSLYPAALNAANEEAVAAFLSGRCGFLQITDVNRHVLEKAAPGEVTLESVIETDLWARETVREYLGLR